MAALSRLALGLAALTFACSAQDDRPPPAANCTGGGCITYGSPMQTGGNRRPGDGGAAPAVDAGPRTDVSGRVRVYQDGQFSSSTDFVGDGVVGGEAPAGRVTAEFSGALYTLEGALADPAIWADLEPTDTVLDVMPTLQRVDPTAPDADLYFVQLGTMEEIATALLAPVDMNPARGHAVLTFVDASGNGISGVEVTSHTGDSVAYDLGNGIFRDDQPGTTGVGRAVVLNAQALGFPGGATSFSYAGARSGTVTIKLAAGGVTLLTVPTD